ncbi:MAG: prepilin-type N-terminal cleavage/methylation domain-containing protein [bacterium]|nr:prepilin-type N-terminal cleavage/methylation domain-containing protein [bacterium]
MTNTCLPTGKKGLTLVELLITLVISSIIIGAAVALHIHNQRTFAKEEALTDARSNTRGGLGILIDDLRMAGCNPREAADFTPGIKSAYSDSIRIAIDIDTNGTVSRDDERRGYYLSGDNLYRYILPLAGGIDTIVVAENIDYLEFRYFDSNGTELLRPVDVSQLENIKSVKIVIVGRTAKEFSDHKDSGMYPNGQIYDDRYYRCWDSTYVRLRNL